MIDYINHRLVCWAEWAIRRDDGGLGFPRQSHYTKAFLSHSGRNVEEINEEAMEIETGVLLMRRSRDDLYLVVMEFYRRTGSAEYKAKKLHVCKDTMYSHLHQSHIWLMEWLQEQTDYTKDSRVRQCHRVAA